MYVLIVSIMVFCGNCADRKPAITMHSIPGFKTEHLCIEGGNAVETKHTRVNKQRGSPNYSPVGYYSEVMYSCTKTE